MSDNPAAFIATETGQQKTFTATYTFPPGAVEGAQLCCELAGLTVIDTNDDATAERVAQALWDITIPHWVTTRPADLTGPLKEQLHERARAILAALREGAQ